MSASLTPSPKMQFFDANGDPLVGGKLYTYAAGTTTPLATYTDSTGGTPNTNPVVMNARGEASVWLGTSPYYFELKDSTDVLIWTADNITGQITSSQVQSGSYQWLTSVSGADTITAVASPVPDAYAAGQTWKFVSAGANTGAVTLNISSLGARSVTKNGSTALSANDIPSGSLVEVTDDGTRLQLNSVNTSIYAKSGANSDITSLSGLTTPLSVAQGGTGSSTGAPAGRLAPNFANSSTQVAQRATAGTLSTSRVIGQCDNIGVWASGGSVSAGTITQISTAISGTTGYACRAAGVTLTGSGVISHSIRMESLEAKKYKNQTASFSVKVDHDVGSAINYTLVVKKANSANDFSATTTISTSGATSVSSATATTLTFNGVSMGDCSNGIDFEVQAACGAVTTKNFNCTEFNIDLAATAQTYSAPEYADELQRCMRYLPSLSTGGGTDETVGFGSASSTTAATIPAYFPVTPRVIPTGVIVSNGAHGYLSDATTDTITSSIAFVTAGLHGARLTFTTAGGLTQNRPYRGWLNNASAYILFTGAEL